MRLAFACLIFILLGCRGAFAQQDSLPVKQQEQPAEQRSVPEYIPFVDSAALAKVHRKQFMVDSITMQYLLPDPSRPDQFTETILKNRLSTLTFLPLKLKDNVLKGKNRNSREPWVIVVIIALLIYTALLNLFLGNEVRMVLQSFYNKNALSQTDKEAGLINSWAFIGLYILFSLSFGLVLYQLTRYYNISYTIAGFRLFLTLSVLVSLLFILKFLVLKLIGFLFNTGSLVSEYISVLNLTYFNIAYVLLAIVICFSLLSSHFVPLLLTLTIGLVSIIFAWQYLRNSLSIVSNFRFHKFYLFIYLCTLEICPVLILIKALNI